jgi:hypothetical protein
VSSCFPLPLLPVLFRADSSFCVCDEGLIWQDFYVQFFK